MNTEIFTQKGKAQMLRTLLPAIATKIKGFDSWDDSPEYQSVEIEDTLSLREIHLAPFYIRVKGTLWADFVLRTEGIHEDKRQVLDCPHSGCEITDIEFDYGPKGGHIEPLELYQDDRLELIEELEGMIN